MSGPREVPEEWFGGPAPGEEGRLGDVEFEALIREVLARMHGVLDEQARLRLLLDAVLTMAADLSLESVLSRIVGIASRLVDADYAALGVLGVGPEQRLRTFVHHGLAPEQVARLGDLPAGHGLLGLIIDRPEPLRLRDIAEHPQSFGFPPHHPPMHSFLGVPVRIRGEVFGNLYLTEKAGGIDFSAEDEAVVVALAAAAGVVIENARLYEEAARREAWSSASAEMTTLVTGSTTGAGGLEIVVERARAASQADAAWAMVVQPGGEALRVAAWSSVEGLHDAAQEPPLTHPVLWRAVRHNWSGATDQLFETKDKATDGHASETPRLGPAVAAPLDIPPGSTGVLCLAWTVDHRSRYRVLDPEALARFARQAGLALQVAAAHEDEQRLLILEDRDRIARDLHDLVVQRLFAVGLGLQGATRFSQLPAVLERLDRAIEDLDTTIKDIRGTIFALGATESAEDLQTMVTKVVDRAAAALKVRPQLRFEGPVRSAATPEVAADVLAVLVEALSNASRHAEASRVAVTVSVDDHIVLTVADDGRGMGNVVVESGLANLRHRAERRGGRLTVFSRPGEGTTLRWAVPVD